MARKARKIDATEDEFRASVVDMATRFKWRVYHVLDSRKSIKQGNGFPDLVLLRRGQLMFVELKTKDGRLEPKQVEWRDELREAGQDWRLWRPADMDAIERILR